MTTKHPSQVASRAAGGTAVAPGGNAMMPLVGLMVRPFPEPGPTIRTAMEQLQQATVEPPADEEALRELAQMPRPWDPATCTGSMRTELWAWLDLVAMWVNEQHLWNVTRTGPIDSSLVASYSLSSNAFSIRSLLPQQPTIVRNVSRAPGGPCSSGRAGLTVPGQRSTGTGCWRGA